MLIIPENSLATLDGNFLPQYSRKDFTKQINFFRGKSILLSKNRDNTLKIQGENIDVDFSWMCYLFRCEQNNFKVKNLPFSSVTLKDIILGLIVTELLGVQLPDLILSLPRVNIDKPLELDNLSKSKLKLFYLRVFGSKNKELNFSSQDLQELNNLDLPQIPEINETVEIRDLWLKTDTNKYFQFLKKIRNKKF